MLNPYISYHLLRGDKGESRHHLPKHSVRAANVPHQTFGNAKCRHEHSCDVCVALWPTTCWKRLKQNQRKFLVLIEHMHWKPKTLQTVWQIVTNDGKNPRTILSHLISYITQNSNASQQAEELRSTSHALWSPKSHFQQLHGFWIILVQYMSHSASYSLYWSLMIITKFDCRRKTCTSETKLPIISILGKQQILCQVSLETQRMGGERPSS